MNEPHAPLAVDPICGMKLNTQEIVATFTYVGRMYVFCSEECYEMFVRAPGKHVVFLAHELEGHYGYCCPLQRQP